MDAKVGSLIIHRSRFGRTIIGFVTDIPEHDTNMLRVEHKKRGRWIRRQDVLDVVVA